MVGHSTRAKWRGRRCTAVRTIDLKINRGESITIFEAKTWEINPWFAIARKAARIKVNRGGRPIRHEQAEAMEEMRQYRRRNPTVSKTKLLTYITDTWFPRKFPGVKPPVDKTLRNWLKAALPDW
jgi:hypothetical protein